MALNAIRIQINYFIFHPKKLGGKAATETQEAEKKENNKDWSGN